MKRRALLGAAGAAGAALGAPGLLAGCASPGATSGGASATDTAGTPYTDADLQHAQRLRDLALQDGQAYALAGALARDIGPRPAGSPGDARAVAWAQRELASLGLAAVRAEPLAVRVWQRGEAHAALRGSGAAAAQPLVMAALGNSVPTPREGLEAEVAYFKDFAALRAEPVQGSRAAGRIVFVDQSMQRTRDGSGYGAAVGVRVNGAAEAARRGALALGIRSIGTSSERIAHTGAMRYDLSAPRVPAFAVSVPDAMRIAERVAAGETLRLKLSLDAREGVEATTHNVIAEVPGSDLAHEIVLIGAHLDSWDLGAGAEDNAAGVGIVSAAAALIARSGRRPRRTVRVVLFASEENGFDGALDYGRRHGGEPHQLVGESDFGSGRVWMLRSRVAPAALAAIAPMARLLAPLGVAPPPAEGGNEGTPGPDAAVLMRRQRWPALQLHQDGSRYFDVHHTVHDTAERLDAQAMRQNVACWATCAWLAAQSRLPFGPPAL